MTNSKNTKRALFASVISMLLCLTMLIGSTFAWFTDNASTNVNKIEAGTLNIELYQQVYESAGVPSEETNVSGMTTPVFAEDIRWEPGYVAIANFRIENAGNLAAKVSAKLVPTGEVGKLADAIDVYVSEAPLAKSGMVGMSGRDWFEGMIEAGTCKNVGSLADVLKNGTALVEGTLNPAQDYNNSGYLFIALKMREDAGNEYQGQVAGAFDILVQATQASYESDSYNNQYDKDAKYPDTTNYEWTSGDNTLNLDNGTYEKSGNAKYLFDASGENTTLTINGNGNIVANEDDALVGYATAVCAQQGATITINGGNYSSVIRKNPPDGRYDLIYAKSGGKIIINGGSFKNVSWDTAHTVNCKNDNSDSSIVINGGEFFEWNPANGPADQGDDIKLGEGKTVREEVRSDGTWYIVE